MMKIMNLSFNFVKKQNSRLMNYFKFKVYNFKILVRKFA